MKIDVYDTYATSRNGQIIHFDVFVEHGTDGEKALAFAKEWLSEIGENSERLDQSRCNFCHSEMANADLEKSIKTSGYYILQMEGCQNPN